MFRAFDPAMDSLVAIKTLVGDADPELLIRFRNEAAAARKLQHKNIITVYDFGEEGRVPYIVMELLNGEDLDRTIRSGRPLSLLQKMLIMSEVAEGLNYAHTHGVVHRDVKPANIMLLSNGSVKIMDFGIALVTQATGQRLTPQGTIMGSFRYMAPEQFEGLPSDELCDIFAFGVIYSQLLTGRHPFEASEAAAVMRKIIRAEPLPIQELCPACPAPLEQILHRLLHKDRDLRYHSLEEVQFDIEPILLDLQKTHTVELLERARYLVAHEQADAAQAAVKEILRLDPGNTGARELRELLQHQQQRKLTHARVEALLKTGREKLEQQEFSGAIESFESALRLDRSNAELQKLIQQARSAMERVERARILLDDARRSLSARDLTGAYSKATEAQRLDPRNSDTVVLLELIQRERETHEREQRLQEGLSRAKSSLMLQAFDEAIALLMQLQPDYPQSTEVAELLAKARREKSLQAQRQRLLVGLEHGKDLLRHQRLADAVHVLEQLDREFHEVVAVHELLSYAREELAKQRRAEAVARAGEDARASLGAQQFDRAIETLKNALQSFPGEDSLLSLLQSIISAKAESERRNALAEALRSSQALVAHQRYQEALACIDAFTSRHGADTALSDLHKRAQAQFELQQRIDAIGRVLGEARGLIEQGRDSTATHLLHEATARFPGEPEIAALLEVAQTKLVEHRRAEAVRHAVNEAAGLTKTLHFDRALEVVSEGLKKYPDDPELTRCLEATRLARSNHQRQMEKREAIERIRRMYQAGRYADALSEISGRLSAAPDDAELLGLKSQIEADWEARERREAVQQVLAQAQALLNQNRHPEAVSLLEASLRDYPDDADLRSLLDRVNAENLARQRAEALRQCVTTSEDLTKALQFDGALEILQQALLQYPGEDVLIRVRAATLAARAAHQREQVRRQAIEQAESLHREGCFAEALIVVDSALRDHPDDPSLLAARKEVQTAWERHERQNAVAQMLSEAQGLLNQGFIEPAISFLETTLRRYPGDSGLTSALASAREMLAARRREEDVRQRINEAEELAAALHFDRAIKTLDKGLQSYPGDPEFLRSRQAIVAARAAHSQAKIRQETLQRVDKLHHRERFDDALQLLKSVLSQLPEDPDLLAAKARIESDWEARKRSDAVEQVLGQAQRLLSQGLHDRAMLLIEDSLRQYPEHPGLSSLLARTRQELQARLEAEQARLREVALQRARPVTPAPPSSPVLETAALPRPPARWLMVLAATAALAVLTVGVVMVWRPLHPRMVSLEVRSEPPGATVQINERSCGTPTCRFDLPPGTYRIEARMSGFRPAERSVTLDARKPMEPVAISLQPEPLPVVEQPKPREARASKHVGTLVVRTDPVGAEVFIDGVNNGRTDRTGVLQLSLSAHEHSVRVERMGFRTPGQQRLMITEGSTVVIPFTLTPQNVQVNQQGLQEGKTAPPQPIPSGAPKPSDAAKAPDPAALEWEQVRNSRDPEVIEAYLRKYPASPHIAEAQTRIEDLVWNNVNQTDINALRDFVGKYPRGAHAAEARLTIEKLDWEAVQRIAAERDTARQATAEQLNRDRQSIIKALQRFSAAIESQNAEEIKAIFPNMSLADLKPFQQKDVKFEVSLQMLSNPEITGDKATVECKRAVVTTYRGRVRPPKVDHVQVNLDRSGGSWIIVSLIPR